VRLRGSLTISKCVWLLRKKSNYVVWPAPSFNFCKKMARGPNKFGHPCLGTREKKANEDRPWRAKATHTRSFYWRNRTDGQERKAARNGTTAKKRRNKRKTKRKTKPKRSRIKNHRKKERGTQQSGKRQLHRERKRKRKARERERENKNLKKKSKKSSASKKSQGRRSTVSSGGKRDWCPIFHRFSFVFVVCFFFGSLSLTPVFLLLFRFGATSGRHSNRRRGADRVSSHTHTHT